MEVLNFQAGAGGFGARVLRIGWRARKSVFSKDPMIHDMGLRS